MERSAYGSSLALVPLYPASDSRAVVMPALVSRNVKANTPIAMLMSQNEVLSVERSEEKTWSRRYPLYLDLS